MPWPRSRRNTIFTNVALTPDGGVWWEGMTNEPPAECLRLAGPELDPGDRRNRRQGGASERPFHGAGVAVPDHRPDWENPDGVPISAIVFGGRRATTMPLVFQTFNWTSRRLCRRHDGIGNDRRRGRGRGQGPPRPHGDAAVCGYHMGDYFRHWLKMQASSSERRAIFHVNWFRKDDSGEFIWPGFGQNMRVLTWIVDRVQGRAKAKETPIGWVPQYEHMDWAGLSFPRKKFEELAEHRPGRLARGGDRARGAVHRPPQSPATGDGVRAPVTDLPVALV